MLRLGAAALGVDCVLVRPASALGRELAGDLGWREVARHPDAATYIRQKV
jgi:hypothetical protein